MNPEDEKKTVEMVPEEPKKVHSIGKRKITAVGNPDKPAVVWCQPDNPLEPRHPFQTAKAYLVNEDSRVAIVICPVHAKPYFVDLVANPQRQEEPKK